MHVLYSVANVAIYSCESVVMSTLFLAAGILGGLAIVVLSVAPGIGISLVLLARPVVDASWDQMVVWELNWPRMMSVMVPLLVLFHMFVTARGEAAFRHMPVRWVWIPYSLYCLVFSVIIFVQEGGIVGTEVFFRHINGIVGFFALQAYFNQPELLRRVLITLLVAGLFPLGVGLYQLATGASLNEQLAEGLVRRVGFYHDGFTVRFYMMQTLLCTVLYAAMFARRAWIVLAALAVLGAACSVMVYFSYSKSAVATLVLWGIVWVVFQRDWKVLFGGAVLALALVALSGGVVVESLSVLFRKEIGFAEGEVGAQRLFAGRMIGWIGMLNEWSQLSAAEQWFGAGRRATGAHNDYLQLLFHGGIVGVLLYLLLLVTLGVKLLRRAWSKDVLATVGLMALAMWLVDSIGLVPSSYPGYQWFIWGVIGLALRGVAPQETTDSAKERAVDAQAAEPSTGHPGLRHPLALPVPHP